MKYTLTFPQNYAKIHLPGLRPWLNAITSGQYLLGSNTLLSDGKYSVLGVLSAIQGRLQQPKPKADGDTSCLFYEDGVGGPSDRLANDNPAFPILGSVGEFPKGVVMYSETGAVGGCILAADTHGYSANQLVEILQELYY